MKALNQVNVYIIAVLAVVTCAKDEDEGRPYEFGFTIDGEQHRHEKRDEKGIVQGEFGFITADGIYHVTVYATDENGNFKILSMRNIKINSSHNDEPTEQERKAHLSKQKSPMTEKPVEHYEPISVTQKPDPYVFTTKPTIKPACGGCGYITTGQPFKIKTASVNEFKKINNIQNSENTQTNYNLGVSKMLLKTDKNEEQFDITKNQTNISNHQQTTIEQVGIFSENSGRPKYEVANQEVTTSSSNLQQILTGVTSYPGIKLGSEELTYQRQKIYPNKVSAFSSENNPHVPLEIQQQVERITSKSTAGFGPITLKQSPISMSKLPPISITGETIHIGGSKPIDIPIKDKYSGMVNGLPNGIEKQDIEDILYKFHYTVGFHGHYEKGLRNGAKIGGYFVNGRDGISRIVTYTADENGYRPKFKFINLGLDSPDTPRKETEKQFGLKSFEFIWYPIES